MKRVIWCAVLIVMLVGCGTDGMEVPRIAERELRILARDLAQNGQGERELQENLAMWYNQNLIKASDPAFRNAYGGILFYTDGIMGSLEVPGAGLHMPIYHGTATEIGFGHDPSTPYPIGQAGEHTVLTTQLDLTLAPGDSFVIHILGTDLTYEVTAVRKKRDTTPVPAVTYCSIIDCDGNQILALRTE